MTPISKETALRSDQPTQEPVVDPKPLLPSDLVAPTDSDTVPQQGVYLYLFVTTTRIFIVHVVSNQPGNDSNVHAANPTPSAPIHGQRSVKVPFKEQVIGEYM
jgi:hypothetical protein